MKRYRRNWVIGVAMMICGAVLLYVAEPGMTKNIARFMLGAGLILAGWSGSDWMEKERSPEKR
jgi:4-amino-4-deoxy-L-arabinose transferase-like glycosyltransferase